MPVATSTLFTFKPAEGGDPINLTGMVKGPDGAPYVIDRSTKTVYRVDLKAKKATVVARSGQKAGGTTVATPRFLAVGGPDLLILDSKNVLWRWRPSNSSGKGTLTKIKVNGSASWGDDVAGIGTYLKDENRGLYNLYVIDPSEQQIRAYSPAFDGSGFPATSTGWLATARPVDGMTSLYIDGDLFVTEDGHAGALLVGQERRLEGRRPRRRAAPAGPRVLDRGRAARTAAPAWSTSTTRPTSGSSPSTRRTATTRASSGSPAASPAGTTCAAMAVTTGIDAAPDTLIWLSKDGVQQAVLEAVPDVVPVRDADPDRRSRRPGQDPEAHEEALTVAAP